MRPHEVIVYISCVVFLYSFFVDYGPYGDLKEGDCMGHKDDVLLDDKIKVMRENVNI